MKAEKKGELLALLIGFFIALGFTIITILKMIETLSIQQEISKRLGIPIYDPYIPMFILLSLVPTLYLLGRIIIILNEMNRASKMRDE